MIPIRVTHRVIPVYKDCKIIGYKLIYRQRISRNYPVYPWLNELSKWQMYTRLSTIENRFAKIEEITNLHWYFGWNAPDNAGIYVLLGKDHTDMKRILYVGQSLNIGTRLKQHYNSIQKPDGLQYMYKEINEKFEISNITPCYLLLDSNILYKSYIFDEKEQRKFGKTVLEILTILEQFSMDVLHPELNIAPAREIF